jgi:hypothetical protein
MYTFLFPVPATCPEYIIINLSAVRSASPCDQGEILPHFYLVVYVLCFEIMMGYFFPRPDTLSSEIREDPGNKRVGLF